MDYRLPGHFAALFTILIWGTTFIATKLLLQSFLPVEILVYRCLFGLLTLYVLCPKLLRLRNWRRELVFAAAGLTGSCLYFLLENIALTYTTAANVAIIIAATPMVTALLAWWTGTEPRPGKSFFAGFVIAICGIAIISFRGAAEISFNWKGDVLALIATFVWGTYSLLVKRIAGYGINILQTTRRTIFYGLLFMIPIALRMGFRWGAERLTEGSNLPLLLYLGIGASALCFASWSVAVKRLGLVRTSLYLYVSPVITMVCSVLVLKEHMTGAALLGAGMTLSGLIISQAQTLCGNKKAPSEKNG